MESIIQEVILKVRESKGVVNARHGLQSVGGPATLGRGWGKSLLQRMKFCRCMCTTKAQLPPGCVKELKVEFLQSIVATVVMEKMPDSGINFKLGSDQT